MDIDNKPNTCLRVGSLGIGILTFIIVGVSIAVAIWG